MFLYPNLVIILIVLYAIEAGVIAKTIPLMYSNTGLP